MTAHHLWIGYTDDALRRRCMLHCDVHHWAELERNSPDRMWKKTGAATTRRRRLVVRNRKAWHAYIITKHNNQHIQTPINASVSASTPSSRTTGHRWTPLNSGRVRLQRQDAKEANQYDRTSMNQHSEDRTDTRRWLRAWIDNQSWSDLSVISVTWRIF